MVKRSRWGDESDSLDGTAEDVTLLCYARGRFASASAGARSIPLVISIRRAASAGSRLISAKLVHSPSTRFPRRVSLLAVFVWALVCYPGDAQIASTGPTPTCVRASAVTWTSLADDDEQDQLDAWCGSVGPPVITHAPAETGGAVRHLDVLSWNVHVGAGDVRAVLREVRHDSTSPDVGVVLLLQEVFRGRPSVPAQFASLLKVPDRIFPRRRSPDVEQLARDLGMSVAYVPSMRNGASALLEEREDRGSAILSTEPLRDITAIELPMLKQRRVVVMATVVPRGGHLAPVRVMTTHLDTLGPRGAQARALADYVRSLPADPPLIMGGDLNALWGVQDQTVRTLSHVMRMEACGTGRTHLFGRFDYIFSTLQPSVPRSCQTLQDKYASDHRPLLLRLAR
jgi:endonuclease/exonuclease/phosphatase family metal-dependent hydrolase